MINLRLIPQTAIIGGIQVDGLGASDIDSQPDFANSSALGGIALELHRRISTYYGRLDRLDHVISEKIKDPTVWRFESRVAEMVIMKWLHEYPGIEVIKVLLTTT